MIILLQRKIFTRSICFRNGGTIYLWLLPSKKKFGLYIDLQVKTDKNKYTITVNKSKDHYNKHNGHKKK